jgi:hypothetical protein
MSILKNKAEAASETNAKKTDKKTIIVNNPAFDKSLQKLAELKAKMDAIETQMNLVKEEINPMGMEIFNEEYQRTGVYPESFNVQSKSGATAMWIPTDKYKKLTKETFVFLDGKYNDVVEDIIEYGLKADVLNRKGVGEKVEKALIKAIGEELTNELITAKSTKQVKKGTIEKALTVGKGKKGNVTIGEFMSDIQPVAYFKDPRK